MKIIIKYLHIEEIVVFCSIFMNSELLICISKCKESHKEYTKAYCASSQLTEVLRSSRRKFKLLQNYKKRIF